VLPTVLDTPDWEAAFLFAAEAQPVPGSACPAGGFTRADVEDVLFLEEGETGGPAWIGLFHLRDGRYAYLAARKATEAIGFYCGDAQVAGTFHELITFGVGETSRRRFDLCLPSDPA
jgi:hypothetical protein